jgi:hypothetical protein
MLKLTMTTFRSCQVPSILLKKLDDLLHFHNGIIRLFLKKEKRV